MYNPSSPFHIISVGRFYQHFGIIESLPTNYEEGTWVKLCASYTNFTWDHGHFTCRFAHYSGGLPELSVDIGSSTMSTFSSKLQRIYNDTVHFCFATAVEYDNDGIEANVEDSGDDIFGEDNFKPVMGVYYKPGDDHNTTARHINTVEVMMPNYTKFRCRTAL